MQPLILPPENEVTPVSPELKLRHFPLVLLYLGASVGVMGVFIFAAVVLEAITALLAFVLIAALVLLLVPILFLGYLPQATLGPCPVSSRRKLRE